MKSLAWPGLASSLVWMQDYQPVLINLMSRVFFDELSNDLVQRCVYFYSSVH